MKTIDDALLTPQQRYCRDHADRVKASKAKYRAKNQAKLLVAGAKYRLERKDTVKASKKRWRLDNREAVRVQKRATSHNMRANKLRIPGRLRAIDLTSRKATCFYCGFVGECGSDHVVPLSRGGENTAENLVPACQSCNSSKSNKLLSEWSAPCRKKSA